VHAYYTDDDWLELNPASLDAMLNKMGDTNTTNFDLEQVAKGVNSFVEQVSSHEGAEFPKLVFFSYFR